MIDRGFITIKRGILSHPIVGAVKPFSVYEAWQWLLFEAAYKARRVNVGGVVVHHNRGQLSHSERFLAEKWGWSKSKVHRFLRRLETELMVNLCKDHETNLITICNYDEHQLGRTADEPASEPQTGPAADQQRTKDKEGKKEIIDIDTPADAGTVAVFPDEPSTESVESPRGLAQKYAFESGVIKLNAHDLDLWRKSFSNLDLDAELLSLTEWAAGLSPGRWFFAVSGALAKRNREMKVRLEEAKAPEKEFKWTSKIEGVI